MSCIRSAVPGALVLAAPVLAALLLGCGGAEKTPTNAASCDVEGVSVEAGRTLPDRDCFVCDPAVTTGDLTMLAIGTPCDDGRAATTGDACDGRGRCVGNAAPATGCTIAGATYGTGESPAAHPCVFCDPSTRTTSWTMRKSGSVCDDGDAQTTGDKCDGAGRCAGTPVAVVPGLVGGSCGEAHPCREDLYCHESICRETCVPSETFGLCSEDVYCLELDADFGVCVAG